jgi:hypothetical protein
MRSRGERESISPLPTRLLVPLDFEGGDALTEGGENAHADMGWPDGMMSGMTVASTSIGGE